MSLMPKIGTIEAVVLAKLMRSENGITYMDFDPMYNMTDEKLAAIIENLKNGMFESEDDSKLKIDA